MDLQSNNHRDEYVHAYLSSRLPRRALAQGCKSTLAACPKFGVPPFLRHLRKGDRKPCFQIQSEGALLCQTGAFLLHPTTERMPVGSRIQPETLGLRFALKVCTFECPMAYNPDSWALALPKSKYNMDIGKMLALS